jgi:hypothetical protein
MPGSSGLVKFSIACLAGLLVAPGCGMLAAEHKPGAFDGVVPDSADSRIAVLTEVPTGTAATGRSVAEVLTLEDARAVIGLDNLYLGVPTA